MVGTTLNRARMSGKTSTTLLRGRSDVGAVVAALCDAMDRPVGRVARGHALVAVLHMVVGLEHVVVERWTGKGFEAIGRTASACSTPRTQELHVGSRRVGRLQIDAHEVRRSHLTLLEAVAPLLARAIAPHARPSTPPRAPTKVPPSGLEVAKESWGLTKRQVETLELVVRGLANKEISAVLGCTPGTVDHHVRALLRKAGLDSRAALVAAFWAQVVSG